MDRTTNGSVGWKRLARAAGRGRRAAASLVLMGFALLAAGPVVAATVESRSVVGRAASNGLGDDELIIEEVFTSHLPATLQKYRFRLSVNPHLGDWQRKEHMRLTTSLRYGLTENFELSATSHLFFSHGHGAIRAFDDYGAANLKLGVKVDLGQPLIAGWETGVGVNYEFPVGRPPPELTDGLRHLRPYVSFSHRLESRPAVRIFVGFRLDAVTTTSLPGEFATNAFRESSTGITGGWVIDRGNLHYTFEASFDSTRLLSRTEEDIYSIRPGVLWEIPTRRNREILSHWVVGFALNNTYGPGGNSLGASFKLRYSRDLKRQSHRP